MPRNPKKLSAPPIAAFKIGLQTQVFKIVCKHTYIIKQEKLNKQTPQNQSSAVRFYIFSFKLTIFCSQTLRQSRNFILI